MRQIVGDILAEGSARASAIVGGGSEELLVTVKKEELAAHMPHVKPSLGLIFVSILAAWLSLWVPSDVTFIANTVKIGKFLWRMAHKYNVAVRKCNPKQR